MVCKYYTSLFVCLFVQLLVIRTVRMIDFAYKIVTIHILNAGVACDMRLYMDIIKSEWIVTVTHDQSCD